MAMMDDKSSVFVDTNILIQATVKTTPFHEVCARAVSVLWESESDVWISRQILREYASVLSRPQTYAEPASPATIASQLRTFIEQFRVADENEKVTENLLQILETIPIGGKQIHDANIVATMQTYGAKRLLTLNIKDFTRFVPGIVLLAPDDLGQ